MKNLDEIFSKYSIHIDKNQKKQFDLYFDALIETNKNLNLTAITDEEDVLIKHFLDSALPRKLIPKNATVVDVGSGAGFPALPLKIVRPDLDITMVDSLNKRVDFLEHAISLLNLQRIKAIHSRAEDFAKNHRESFDVAVARAVAPLNTLVEYLLPLIKVGGCAVIYKSAKLEEEIKESEKAIKVLGGEIKSIKNYHIEEGDLQRKVLVVIKVSATPSKYPRSQNKPKLNPIK